MITAGPASGTAEDSTKKMPVPTVAPTPNIISWKVPMVRFSCGPCRSPIGLRRKSPPALVGDNGSTLMGLRSVAARFRTSGCSLS